MADYEKNPSACTLFEEEFVPMCICLFLCVLLWPSMSLYGSTSKAAFSKFLLFHLLLLLVGVYVCECARCGAVPPVAGGFGWSPSLQ